MDFDSPDVMKDFPGLYASELNKQCNNDSDYSDENEKGLKKDILIGKRKDKKDKDKGYAALEGESSADEKIQSRSPSKAKKTKSFKFSTKPKEKRDKSRDKDEKKKGRDKKVDKVKSDAKGKKVKQSSDDITDIGDVLPIFGVSLELAVERSPCHDDVAIPLPVRECVDHIENVGMTFEGLYKVSGTKSKVLQARKLYNQRGHVSLADYDIPTVTSLLKNFLRDLPEPIFSNDLLIRFEEAGAILNLNTRQKHLKILVQNLPPANHLLMGRLARHLHNISLHEKVNKMDSQHLAAALNHTFHCSSRLLHAIIHHSLDLFPSITIARYIPPLESGARLPEAPQQIECELRKQESLLSQIHREMNFGCISKEREELLWEVQRIITQLKRKLKTFAQKDKEVVPCASTDKCEVEVRTEEPRKEDEDRVQMEAAKPDEAAPETSEEPEEDHTLTFLQYKNDSLQQLQSSLVKRIHTERSEIAALRNQLINKPPSPITIVPHANLDEVMDLFMKENQILQIKKINLVRQIIEEQELCIELNAQLNAKP